MRSIPLLPAPSRVPLLGLVVTAALLAATVPGTAAAQQAAPGRVFGSEAGMIFNPIKPDKTADFEMVMAKLKEALAKSEVPQRKEQAAGWKLYKSVEPGPNNSVLYIFVMDPAVKGADYTISKILSEVFPAEVQDLYQKFSDAYAGGQSMVNLTLIQSFGR